MSQASTTFVKALACLGSPRAPPRSPMARALPCMPNAARRPARGERRADRAAEQGSRPLHAFDSRQQAHAGPPNPSSKP